MRKEGECQRRYSKLMTDVVHHSIGCEDGGGGGGRKRAAAAGGGGNDKREMSKGPWTEEEDRKVVELVGKYGPKKWSQIALELPGAGEFVVFIACVVVEVVLCTWTVARSITPHHLLTLCTMYMSILSPQDALENNVVNAGTITSTPKSPKPHGPQPKIASSSNVTATALAINGPTCPNSYQDVPTMPLRIIGILP